MKPRICVYLIEIVACQAFVSVAVNAQHATIEPQAGVWFLTGSGSEISNSPAPYVGLRFAYPSSSHLRLTAGVAYLWKDNAQTIRTEVPDGRVRTDVYGVTYVPVTVGGEYALVRGATMLSAGLEVGGVWTRQPLLHSSGPPAFAGTPPTRSETGPLIAPNLTFGRKLGERLSISANARMLIGGASAGGVPMLGASLGWLY